MERLTCVHRCVCARTCIFLFFFLVCTLFRCLSLSCTLLGPSRFVYYLHVLCPAVCIIWYWCVPCLVSPTPHLFFGGLTRFFLAWCCSLTPYCTVLPLPFPCLSRPPLLAVKAAAKAANAHQFIQVGMHALYCAVCCCFCCCNLCGFFASVFCFILPPFWFFAAAAVPPPPVHSRPRFVVDKWYFLFSLYIMCFCFQSAKIDVEFFIPTRGWWLLLASFLFWVCWPFFFQVLPNKHQHFWRFFCFLLIFRASRTSTTRKLLVCFFQSFPFTFWYIYIL